MARRAPIRWVFCCFALSLAGVGPTAAAQQVAGVIQPGQAKAAVDWTNLPAGIVLGLMHSANQSSKRFVAQGDIYYACGSDQPGGGMLGLGADPVPGLRRQMGGDLGAPSGVGYCWFETAGERFTFTAAQAEFACDLPPGLVIGLKHSQNQRGKTVAWAATLDPAAEVGVQRFCLERQNGGDRGASEGVGYYWYETTGARFDAWDAPRPQGLVFGLKHTLNQPTKVFVWRNRSYDPARPDAAPPGFERYCGGDRGAPSGHGYCWFESTGEGWTADATPPSTSTPVTLEPGVNRPGRDYRSFPTSSTPGACQQACADDPGCLAFTWVRPGVQRPEAVCWLKNSVPPAGPDQNCVSGVRVAAPAATGQVTLEQGVDRPGQNYRNFPTTASPGACQKACGAEPECRAYTWVRPGVQGPQAVCWLKNGVPGPVTNGACVSGVKR